jgi:hypothetical protein
MQRAQLGSVRRAMREPVFAGQRFELMLPRCAKLLRDASRDDLARCAHQPVARPALGCFWHVSTTLRVGVAGAGGEGGAELEEGEHLLTRRLVRLRGACQKGAGGHQLWCCLLVWRQGEGGSRYDSASSLFLVQGALEQAATTATADMPRRRHSEQGAVATLAASPEAPAADMDFDPGHTFEDEGAHQPPAFPSAPPATSRHAIAAWVFLA